jgi:anhydro-N-acetylmuramic acid kinase
MSGTSLDGIDAVLVRFSGTSEADVDWSVRAFVAIPYRPEQRRQIHDAVLHGTPADLCRLHADLGEWFGAAALAVCTAAGVAPDDVDLIGSHGQTIWHLPPVDGMRGATLQLGDPATIAERTGIPVVSDFRARDMAAGGQGAPLVPWQDRVLFSLPGRRRVLQNIGGIANLSWLPPKGDPTPLLAFDTGPGNVLIDAAVELATGGRETFDRDGRWAARGRVDEVLLAEILAHPFFQQPPPKSTGRETFGRPNVEEIVRRRPPADEQAWADLVATITAATACSIADAMRRWVLQRGVDEVVISGGGARNPTLVRMIRETLAPTPVVTGEALGIDPDAKEAIAFAGLAWAFACGLPGNVPEATGARGPCVLGSYTPGHPKARQNNVGQNDLYTSSFCPSSFCLRSWVLKAVRIP